MNKAKSYQERSNNGADFIDLVDLADEEGEYIGSGTGNQPRYEFPDGSQVQFNPKLESVFEI